MQIKIYPDDLVKRCIWDSYVYYVIGSEKEAQKILEENNEIELSERDALIIGLLKIIETDNLIHKFNTYIIEILANKSTSNDGKLYIRKKVLDTSIDKFMDKFPEYWNAPKSWSIVISKLKEYIDSIESDIKKLELYRVEDKNIVIDFYSSNSVKKLLKFIY
jgi:hypothetical protein